WGSGVVDPPPGGPLLPVAPPGGTQPARLQCAGAPPSGAAVTRGGVAAPTRPLRGLRDVAGRDVQLVAGVGVRGDPQRGAGALPGLLIRSQSQGHAGPRRGAG